MRLFIAIKFNSEIKNALLSMQEQLKRANIRGNYTKPENLHLTLAFIGEYGDPDYVLETLEQVKFKPFELALDGVGSFGDIVGVIEEEGGDLFVPRQDHYEIESFIDGSFMTIADAPWPGLTPDLLSVLLVVSTQAKGSVLIHQKMFESRLFFVDKLIDMGAQIILCDPHRAVVVGHDHQRQLHAGRMTSPDIRAGIALLIAAMSAQGTSRIDNIGQIDRGYENIEARLCALGAKIERVE